MTRKEIDQIEEREVKRLVDGYDRFRLAVASMVYKLGPANYTQQEELIIKSRINDLADRMKGSAIRVTAQAMQAYYGASREWASGKLDEDERIEKFDHVRYVKEKTTEMVKYFYAAIDDIVRMAGLLLYYTGLAHHETLQLQQLSAQHKNWTQKLEDDIFALIDEARTPKDYITQALTVIPDTFRTRGDVQRAILNTLKDHFGNIDFIEVNGRRFKVNYYIELVARSEMRMAGADAALNTAKEWGTDLVVFSSHADPSEMCAQHENKIMSISGMNPKYPKVVRPVYDTHPNCKHHLSPITQRTADRWELEGRAA